MALDEVTTGWSDPAWIADAHQWIETRVAMANRRIEGLITQPHVRPWATCMRISTDRGWLWFKATIGELGHEAGITEALSRWEPGRTPEVLAADVGRNWLLMADGGATLRSVYDGMGDAARMRRLAATYAELQKPLACHVPEMLALRVPDCRLTNIESLYSALVERTTALPIGEAGGLTLEEAARLPGLAVKVGRIVEELASFEIPETLQHDDLHSNNVLADGERIRVFDWGDCSVSHPFLSLVVLLRGAARDLNAPADGPTVHAIRNAYLDSWDLRLPPAELDRACALADGLGRISRALTWDRLMPGLDARYRAEHEIYVHGWLKEFLDVVDSL